MSDSAYCPTCAVVDFGATENRNSLTFSAEYGFDTAGHPASDPFAFASRTIILPSLLTDCTIPVCPIAFLSGFDTNNPPTTGVSLLPISDSAAYLSFSVSPIPAFLPVTDSQ